MSAKYVATLAKILSDNTLIYSSYICQELRLCIEIKIVFEAHKDHTWILFYIFRWVACNPHVC